MTSQLRFTRLRRSRTAIGLLALAVFGLPAASMAETHTINLLTCPTPQSFDISADVGTPLNDQIITSESTGDVIWVVNEAPQPGCALAGDNVTYNCANGVVITLPAPSNTQVSSASPIQITGTPTSKSGITLDDLEVVDVGDATRHCTQQNFAMNFAVDVAFVLDRSGSMGAPADPLVPGTSRWDALEAGANGFAPLLATTAANGSRFGLTLFNQAVLPNGAFPAGMTPVSASLAGDLSTKLSGESPGGATALGLGVKDAEAKMANCNRPRVAVVFTDGQQNQPPEVLNAGTGYDDGTSINTTCPAGPEELEVVSVGIMGPGSAYLSTLQNLATQNGGNQTIISTTGTSFSGGCVGNISQAFNCAVVPALAGNSPQLIATHSGDLIGTVNLPPFPVNARVSQLLIQINFSRRFEIPNLIQLLAGIRVSREGTDVTGFFQPIFAGNFTGSILLRTNFTHESLGSIAPDGEWAVQLTELPNSQRLGFEVVVFADDHRLGMDWGVSPAAPRVDVPFEARMTLDWRGDPLTGADVEVLALVPGDDLAEAVGNHPSKIDPSSAPDAGSPGYQKYLALLEDSDFLAQILPSENVIPLTDPDNDGTYTGSIDPGDVSGVYQLLYRVRADAAPFGAVRRIAAQSVYVRFGEVDLAASGINTATTPQGATFTFTPRTTNGRAIGVDQGSAMSFDSAGLTVASITDNQDNSYTVNLAGDPDSEVSISILDEEIYSGPASEFGSEGGGLSGLPWWVWLLLLLVLLVIWILRK